MPRRAKGAGADRDPTAFAVGSVEVRRWRPDDAPALAASVAANVEHLRPWMPWIAAEPVPLADRRRLLARWEEQWDLGGDRNWGLFHEGRAVGSMGLMERIGPGGLDLGYWIDAGFTGRGLATAVAARLTTFAFEGQGVTHVQIHHDAGNVRSGGVPRRLGYRRLPDRPAPVEAPGETGVSWVWETRRAGWSAAGDDRSCP